MIEPGVCVYACVAAATGVDVNCNGHCDGHVDAMRRDASLVRSRERMRSLG